MLGNEVLEQRLLALDGVQYVKVTGDGYHYKLILVSDVFVGLSKVARQQWVYAQLSNDIVNGSLHALSMDTWTKQEWEKQHG
jgi:acid stress-induced BolA-like protein IbaG/YrbA